jgi:hypothetical protein
LLRRSAFGRDNVHAQGAGGIATDKDDPLSVP